MDDTSRTVAADLTARQVQAPSGLSDMSEQQGLHDHADRLEGEDRDHGGS